LKTKNYKALEFVIKRSFTGYEPARISSKHFKEKTSKAIQYRKKKKNQHLTTKEYS
jgi:hypothetical protein